MDFYITTPDSLCFYDSLKPDIFFPCEFVSLSFSVLILSLISSPGANEQLPLDFAFVWTLRRSHSTYTTRSEETTQPLDGTLLQDASAERSNCRRVTAAWNQCITGANQTHWLCDTQPTGYRYHFISLTLPSFPYTNTQYYIIGFSDLCNSCPTVWPQPQLPTSVCHFPSKKSLRLYNFFLFYKQS